MIAVIRGVVATAFKGGVAFAGGVAYIAAVVFTLYWLPTHAAPAGPAPQPTPSPSPSCAQIARIDSDPPQCICVPVDQAG